MAPLLRWSVVGAIAALSFASTWLVCQLIIGLAADDSSAIGGAAMAIFTAPAAAWAAQPGGDQRGTGSRSGALTPNIRAEYLRSIRRRFSRVDLDVLAPLRDQGDVPVIPLTEVFVPQQVKADPPPVELPREMTLRNGDPDTAGAVPLPGLSRSQLERVREYEQRKPIDVLPLIADEGRRLVFLGDPGSGKSTLARYVVRGLAESNVTGPLAPLAGWLPVLVELRTYAQQDEQTAGDFLDFLEREHGQDGVGLPRTVLESYLERDGRAVVVFDGLDEIFDPSRRDRVARQLAGFAEHFPRARILVTSRPVGYQRSVLEAAAFKRYKFQDLDLDRISQFVRQWYLIACAGDELEARRLEERLMSAIRGSAAIRELSGNPMLLTILTIIGRRQTLPRDRASVYEHAVTVLVEHWDPSKFLGGGATADLPYLEPADRLEMLRLIARKLQNSAAGLSGNFVSGSDLMEEFVAFLRQRDPEHVTRGQAGVAAERMLRQFRDRNFILSRFGGDVYGFVHRSFLEFLTAADIVHRFNSEHSLTEADLIDGIFARRCREVSWHEVLQLTAGMVNERFVNLAVRRMLSVDPHWAASDEVDPHHILVAVRCIGEVRKIGLMAEACGDAIRQVIRMLTIAHRRITRSYTDSLHRAIEQSVRPVLGSFASYWPGRDIYLAWYLANGFVEADDLATGLAATRVAIALCPDDDRLRDFLRTQAREGWSVNHRMVATAGLMRGWAADPESLEIIRTLTVTDPSWEVRQEALRTLVGGDPTTLGLLCDRAVNDDNEEIRRTAVRALASHWIEAPETKALLTDRVSADGHHDVRSAVISLLAKHWREDSAIRTLVRRLATADPHDQVRKVALTTVAERWPRELASVHLVRARAEADHGADVRRGALLAFAKTWPSDPATLPWLRDRAVADPHPAVRQAAVLAIGAGWPQHPDTLDTLAELLTDDSGEVREAVVRALALSGPLPTLLELAENDPSPDVRQAALEAVGPRVRHDETVRGWLRRRAETDTHDRVRAAGVRLVAEGWQEEPLVEVWLHETAARDRSPVVRRAAVTAVATAGRADTDTLPWLQGCAEADGDVDVRVTAVRHVTEGWAAADGARTWLAQRSVVDPDEDVRNVAMRALVAHWHDDPDTFALLRVAAREDPHELIRRAAVWMIADGWPAAAEALPLLRACATDDPHEVVRRAAAQAVAVGWRDRPATLPLLVSLSTDDRHEHVRAGALRSIASGWHDRSETLRLLRQRTAEEKHQAVRSLALQLLVAGWPGAAETRQTAQRLAGDDPAPAVRLTAAHALARHWPEVASSRAVLGRLADGDPDPEVRRVARAALG